MVSHRTGNIRHVLYLDLKLSSTKCQPVFSVCFSVLYSTSGYECESFGKQTQGKGKEKSIAQTHLQHAGAFRRLV